MNAPQRILVVDDEKPNRALIRAILKSLGYESEIAIDGFDALAKLKQGIDGGQAKEISRFIREQKLKVTAQIQGDELRVSGKNRDDLQAVIAAVKAKDFPVALQFINFRD